MDGNLPATAPPTTDTRPVQPRVDAQLCYLLAYPHHATAPTSPPESAHRLKDAPYFEAIDIDIRTLARETVEVEGARVLVRRQVYDGLIQSAECTVALPDALSADALQFKTRLQTALRTRLTTEQRATNDLFEEYAALLIQSVDGAPDEFLDRNGQSLARFMRSQREVFGPHEVDDILFSRARYSERDLTLVDWEGAVIIAPKGDFESDLELLKIGNYQLLRYRLIDQAIEANLRTVGQHFGEGVRPSVLPNRAKRVLRQVIEQRLSIMLDFEKIDQGLLLIGDWYTAKLYHLIYAEFYLDEWKSAIKAKLDSLESINQIVRDNFTFSWGRLLEFMQIAGWLILLVGYFVLFFLDVRALP